MSECYVLKPPVEILTLNYIKCMERDPNMAMVISTFHCLALTWFVHQDFLHSVIHN
jgi:hypothetical protein